MLNALLALGMPQPYGPGGELVQIPLRKSSDLPSHDRVVCISRYDEDTSWAGRVAASWSAAYVLYEKNATTAVPGPNTYVVPVNKGVEASAFLQYVIDHWGRLPKWTFFTHADEYSAHHEGSLSERLAEAAASGRKYFNINSMKNPCTVGFQYRQVPEFQRWVRDYLEPWLDFSQMNPDWFQGSTCCAQFLVHRDQIYQHPVAFYRKLYDWLTEEDDLEGGESEAGRFMEWSWHAIWGDFEARHPKAMRGEELDANIKVINKDKEMVLSLGCLSP